MIDTMFSVPLFQVVVDEWETKKEQILSLYNESHDKSNTGKITTDYFAERTDRNELVKKLLDNELTKFVNEFEADECIVIDNWFEIAYKDQHHPVHNHGTGVYSAVLYVNYNEEEHTPLEFIAPFSNFIDGNALHYTPRNVVEGSLLLFPGPLLHYTHPNESDEPRIVLAFNTILK